MLEGLFFGRGFNRVWHEFPVLNNADISTPHKKNSFCFFALNLFFHLSHSSIFFSCLGHFLISSCIKVLPSSKKSHSSHFPPTQNLPSSSPSSLWTQSLLPLFSLHPALPHSLALFFSFVKDNLNPFLFLFSSILCLRCSLGRVYSICIYICIINLF